MPGKLTFGPFELDVAGERLEKSGIRIRLAGQPMRILILLLMKPGEVITREHLRQELWGDTFVDFEQGLNTAINKLRQTLGDSAEHSRYIETIPGRGYRFIAPVGKPGPVPDAQRGQDAPGGGQNGRKGRDRWKATSVGLAVLAALATGYWMASKTPTPATFVTRFTVEPPLGYWLEPAATRNGFDISPDGKSLVFTARGKDGQFHAWRRDLSETALHPIATAEGAHTVFWGPDSKRLFFAVSASLRMGDAAGGPLVVLSREQDRPIYGTEIAPDRVLAMSTRRTSYLVPIGGGDPRPLPAYPWPELLPDGDHLLYLAFGGKAQDSVVRAARLGAEPDSGVEIVRTNSKVQYAPSADDPDRGYLLYVSAGNLMAQPFDAKALRVTGEAVPLAANVEHYATSGAADFSVSGQGVLVYQPHIGRAQITWVDRSGNAVATVGPANREIYDLRLSPDQTRIAAELYDVEDGYERAWIFDAASGKGRPISEDLAGGTTWSPDSTRLVYSGVIVTRLPMLFTRSAVEEDHGQPLFPGAHPEQLQVPTDWSGDGRFIVYQSRQEGDLWVADLAGDGSLTPLLHSAALESSGAFSPDRRWLAFVSNETGHPEAYLQAFQAGQPPRLRGERFRISRNGAVSVRWRGDGRKLFYAGADGKMYTVPVRLTAQPEIGSPKALFDIEIEATTPVITPFTFDVSADGRRFLLPRLTNRERDHLVVIENWPQLLP